MAHQINLSNKDIRTAYLDVLNANGIDWALFTYEKGSNDLKVQDTGDGGLEAVAEEFSDGRIQYAFVRVIEPTSQLPKFVQINWCGDGVPVFKKGFFASHCAAVSDFLKGSHVVISARSEADVDPSAIMSRVASASGSKYSIHKEPTRKSEPIGPVGTNYTPVGKVDINAIRKEAAVKPPQPLHPTTAKPLGVGQQWSRPATTGFQQKYTPPPPGKPTAAPDDDWEPAPAPVKPTPAQSLPTAARPVPSAPSFVEETPKSTVTKPVEDDRIGPVGTNWEPVQLPKPKKLLNPFEKRAQEALQEQQPKPPIKRAGMTWSERQALAKKQAEEDEARSRASSFKPTPASVSTPKWKAPAAVGLGVGAGITTSVGVATLASKDEEPEEEAEWEAPVPPAPPPPPVAARPPPPPQSEPEPEEEPEPQFEAPPPPPPPPLPPAPVTQMAALSVQEPEPELLPPPPPPPPHPPTSKGKGLCAIVLYEYEASEENEMPLTEGEVIEEIEKLDDGWWAGVGDNGAKRGLFPANYVEEIDQTGEPEPQPAHEPEPEPEPAAIPPPPPPPPLPRAPEPTPVPQDEGTTAIALYDYNADEENEVSFHEGDRIIEIEAVSEDWWQGKTTDGSVGLFPANYVEIQQ